MAKVNLWQAMEVLRARAIVQIDGIFLPPDRVDFARARLCALAARYIEGKVIRSSYIGDMRKALLEASRALWAAGAKPRAVKPHVPRPVTGPIPCIAYTG